MLAYCIKCKKQQEIIEAKKVTMKNGRHAMKGKCKKCGTNVYRIVSG